MLSYGTNIWITTFCWQIWWKYVWLISRHWPLSILPEIQQKSRGFLMFSRVTSMKWIKSHLILNYISGLQIIFQNLSDIMSGRNNIPLDIYKNLLGINFYIFLKTLININYCWETFLHSFIRAKFTSSLLINISTLVNKSRIYIICYQPKLVLPLIHSLSRPFSLSLCSTQQQQSKHFKLKVCNTTSIIS